MNNELFRPVIGLEVHVGLATKSKMFCGCPADHFSKKPNTQTCPVCLGLPGALPVPNKKAVDWTIMLGLALGCSINRESKFDRKHYFYPDLPKGYQVTQYDQPLCGSGRFMVHGSSFMVRIRRVHLEEDTGKLIHAEIEAPHSQKGFGEVKEKVSLVDFNRSGVALVELVTEPDFVNSHDVVSFVKEIQLIVRYLGISDADMEKGSMRLEANISLSKRLPTTDYRLPNYKVELKNINSFGFLKKAIDSEIERQRKILASGGKVVQETRGFDQEKGTTFAQREKEEAHDYRYFPEPDIPPMEIRYKDIKILSALVPELPQKKRERFKKKYRLPDNYIEVLVADGARADYFEEALKDSLSLGLSLSSKIVADVMVNKNLDRQYPEPAGMVRKLLELTKKTYSGAAEVEKAVENVLSANPKAISDYQKGKEQVVGFLIGEVQRALSGRAEINTLRTLLLKVLRKKPN